MAVTSTRAVLLTLDDDVAAVLAALPAGAEASVILSASGEMLQAVKAKNDIPFGHKIAVRPIDDGQKVIRYGYPIGIATKSIGAGEHVHAHNMRSLLSPATAKTDARIRRPASWVRATAGACLRTVGVPDDAAQIMADALTEAHLRGVETHGLRRLRAYLKRIQTGGVAAEAEPKITQHGAILNIDGCNGIGHYIAHGAAQRVSEAASRHGIALGLVKNSNHFGFAGYYATQIAAAGQIGIVTSNGQVFVAPAGAKRPLLSNNPMAIAAPTGTPDAFLELDLAASVTSRANVVEAAKTSVPLPSGIAQDADGAPTSDSHEALAGSLLAFGGDKGFALLFALEALTGVLDGGAYADQVSSKEAAPNAPEGTTHTIIAIDLKMAIGVETYTRRLDDLIARLLSLPTASGAPSIRYPGQRRWSLRAERQRNGIPLTSGDFNDICALANELGVTLDAGEE